MNNLKVLALLAMTAALAACGGGGSASNPAPAAVQPTATLTVDRTAINSGESAMLSWNSTGADACQATDGWSGSLAASGTQSTGALTGGTTFSLTCTQGSISSPTASVRVELVPTVTLTATPAAVASGATAQLNWTSTDATACTASGGWTGAQAASGSQGVGPFSASGDYSYTLVCTGPGGDSTAATTTVNVTGGTTTAAPTATLTANPTRVTSGGASTLTWSSTNATACAATGGWNGAKATSGTLATGALTANTTYLLTCTGAGGTSPAASATVTVTAIVTPAPTVTLSASPASVTTGQTSTLTWSSSGATSCTASGGWTGTKATSGTATTAALTATTTYSLTCTGAGGTSAAPNATVTVTTPAPTVTLTATPTTVTSGGTSTLTWSSTNATSCTASGGWTGSKATSGTAPTAALTATTTYTLACTGAGGSGNGNATVTLVTGSLTPGTVALTVGQSQTFTKTLSGTATFSVDGIDGGSDAAGRVSAAGVYVPGTNLGAHTILATSTTDSSQTQSGTALVTDLTAVTTYHYNQARDGANTHEYALTTGNVKAATFGKLASCVLDGTVVAQPLWVAGLTIGVTRHNVVFVGTHHDGLYAIDADAAPCNILWHMNLADTSHGAGANEVPVPGDQVGAGYGDIMPEVGITSTPVIDLANNIIYVVSKSWVPNSTMYTRLHAIDMTSGAEKTNSPVTIAGSVAGTGAYGTTDTFDTAHQLQRAGLALVNNTVYVSFTAHEDAGTYFGWVFGYQYAGGAFTRTSLINVSPDNIGSGIWMSGGAPAADSSNNLFLLTGNGHYDVNTGGRDYGDSLLKLSTPSLAVSQSWTPTDQAADETYDNDFGAGGAAMLADLPNGSSYIHVLTCGGKSGILEILNRDMLGGYTGATVQEISLGGPLFATAAIWNNRLYVAAGGQQLRHYNLTPSTVQFTLGTSSPTYFNRFGANPIVSASATSNGVVWAMETDNYCTNQSTQNSVTHCGPVVLHAYDALNVGNELWKSSGQAGDAAGYAVKFTSPLVANGHVYVGTRGNNVGGPVSSTSQPGTLEIYGLKP